MVTQVIPDRLDRQVLQEKLGKQDLQGQPPQVQLVLQVLMAIQVTPELLVQRKRGILGRQE